MVKWFGSVRALAGLDSRSRQGRCTGLSTAALAVAFALRAIGDIGDNAVRWVSPIGWAQGGRAFAGERWWPLVLWAVPAIGATVGASRLATRRDLGSGPVPHRPGPATAASWATTPLGLAWVMQRGARAGGSWRCQPTAVVPLVALCVVAAALGVTGLWGSRSRDNARRVTGGRASWRIRRGLRPSRRAGGPVHHVSM